MFTPIFVLTQTTPFPMIYARMCTFIIRYGIQGRQFVGIYLNRGEECGQECVTQTHCVIGHVWSAWAPDVTRQDWHIIKYLYRDNPCRDRHRKWFSWQEAEKVFYQILNVISGREEGHCQRGPGWWDHSHLKKWVITHFHFRSSGQHFITLIENNDGKSDFMKTGDSWVGCHEGQMWLTRCNKSR